VGVGQVSPALSEMVFLVGPDDPGLTLLGMIL